MGKQLRVLTNSELTTRRRCPREHHIAYELGIRPIEDAEALRIGTAIHAGLDPWWNDCALDVVLERACESSFESTGNEDEYEFAKLRAMLIGYDARWAGQTDREAAIRVEQQFETPLINPETGAPSRTFSLGGKIDVVLDRMFVEHKTTSSEIGQGSAYWRRLKMNTQVSTYYAGARSLGVDVEGCMYDVLRKPAQRPSQVPLVDADGVKIVLDAQGERVRVKSGKKWRESADAEQGYVLQTRVETPEEYEARLLEVIAENPDKFYQRGTVVRLESEEREAQLETWQQARAIREAELSQAWPRNPDGCERYGKFCGYFDACCGEVSLDDPSRFTRVDSVHQELSLDVAAAE